MRTGRLLRLVVAASLASAALAGSARAQNPTEALAARCADAGGPVLRCSELAVTARALQGSAGLLAGLGSEVAGSAGTLGRRLGTTPRVAVGARAAFAHVGLPDLADPGAEPSRQATFVVPAVHAGVAVGVFDGFFVLPTVGGVLSLDLLANTSVLFLPTADGFDGKASGWSVGARLGVLRESFTLPGVAVSLTRRDLEPVRFGDPLGAGGGAVETDATVTSVRATVGKDLLSVGLLAGMGWDRYAGSVTLRPVGLDPLSDGSFTHSRQLVFGGASLNFLILQLSAEAGWARGAGVVNGYRGAPFDPARGSGYGSLAFRLTI
ncbi:MAG TPA: hypothetical protein VLH75_02495 [Longimicrobiales bacterium]|nr:hypothetical protein [Longimicrobiales bacterium]